MSVKILMINIWKLEVIFDPDSLKSELKTLEIKTSVDTFWNDKKQANTTLKKIKKINTTIDFYNDLSNQYELLELYLTENLENNSVNNESIIELKKFSKLVRNLEIRTLLNNSNDDKNVILTIHTLVHYAILSKEDRNQEVLSKNKDRLIALLKLAPESEERLQAIEPLMEWL